MSVTAALAVARFVHFAALLVLFGGALFPLYAGEAAARPWGRGRSMEAGLAVAALAAGLAWYALTAAEMAGSLAAAADPQTLWTVLIATSFGLLWLVRSALILLALVFAMTGAARWTVALLSGLALAGLAGTGHAGLPGEAAGAAHAVADGAHLLAAGVWLGGLGALAAALGRPGLSEAQTGGLLLKFSGIGYAAVATLLLSGIVNGWLLVGGLGRLASTDYGRLLTAKILLFLAMAALAAMNRVWITPRLARPDADPRWLARIRRNVGLELALGLAAVAIVSLLGLLQPAVES